MPNKVDQRQEVDHSNQNGDAQNGDFKKGPRPERKNMRPRGGFRGGRGGNFRRGRGGPGFRRNNRPEGKNQQNRNTDSDTNNEDNANNKILATKILQVQNKRYYFDIKEHDYGRFLKLAETSQSRNKNRLVIPMYMVPEMEKLFEEFMKKLDDLPDFRSHKGGSGDNAAMNKTEPAKEHHSGLIEKGRRRYYFNLKENNRGRYLRVKAIGDVPQSMPGRGRRYSNRNSRNNSGNNPRAIVLPSEGILSFKEILTKLVHEFGVDVETDKVAISDKNMENNTENDKHPKSSRFSCRTFRKILFLDAGENSRGTFARVTEQQRNFRESITIPSLHFKEFGEWFANAHSLLSEEEKLANQMAKVAIEDKQKEVKAEKDDGNFRRQHASDSE